MSARQHADGVGKPQARSMSNSSHDAPSVDVPIAGLADLDANQLRKPRPTEVSTTTISPSRCSSRTVT
jgi:hypothetical protein